MKVGYYFKRLLVKLHGSYTLNSVIDKRAKVGPMSQVVNSTFEKYAYCGYRCKIINTTIGRFCSIADNVVIGGATHPLHWVSTSPAFYFGRDRLDKQLAKNTFNYEEHTVIEHDVWIGDGAMIKAGVTVATGAVIGMGAVVTKNIGPYEIWAGNPAKIIKKRFDDETIQKLLQSEWWNYSQEKLLTVSKSFADREAFLKEIS